MLHDLLTCVRGPVYQRWEILPFASEAKVADVNSTAIDSVAVVVDPPLLRCIATVSSANPQSVSNITEKATWQIMGRMNFIPSVARNAKDV